jgi:urease accessory protein
MWLLLQLADSAFPTGGFAHSGGLEAAAAWGEVQGAEELERFVVESLWQAGLGGVPFVGASHAAPEAFARHDAACDAFLTNHVTNRASRTQGRTFLATCTRVFQRAPLARLDEVARSSAGVHFAPVFGAATCALAVERRDAQALYLHVALRGVLSAAVRLGIVGPHEAQRMQHAQAATLAQVLEACRHLGLDEIAQPAPVLDLLAATQDGLYSRLFQS